MSEDLVKRLRDSTAWYHADCELKMKCADRIEELEALLAKAVDGLRQCEAEIDDYIRHEYPGDHPVQARYRKRDFDANPARATLAELTGGKDE